MIIFSSLIATSYSILIGSFYWGLHKKNSLVIKNDIPQIAFSILIAFRNEENNLPSLLASLSQLKYPNSKFEIIFIDDHSEDDSINIIHNFSQQHPKAQIKILSSKKAGKKAAISYGIKHASYDYILTTDADCVLQKLWINAYNSLLQEKEYLFIAGPVSFEGNSSFLHQFQNIDFLSLQGCTIGSFQIGNPFMSNGANSGFHKPTFEKLNGFNGNDNIASGDDVFLLEKINKLFPERIGFLNSKKAIVTTTPQNSWKALFHQRMRWAAKATSYKNTFAIFVGMVIFSFDVIIVATTILEIKLAILLIIGKAILDYLLILKTARFFSKRINIPYYLATSLYHPIFNILVFLSAVFFKFEWKNRVLKK